MKEAQTKSQRIMKAHGKKTLDNMPGVLKDGQTAIWFTPAFEARDPNPSKDYGIGGVELSFAKRKGNVIVDCSFFTDWYPIHLQKKSMGGASGVYRQDVIGEQPLCRGLYTHYLTKPEDDEYLYHNEDCALTGGECWGGLGSGLYGDVIRDRLINEGGLGVWDEIDKALLEADTQGTDLLTNSPEANSRQAEAQSGAGEKGRL